MEQQHTILKVNEHVSLRTRDINAASELFALVNENRERLREWLPWVDDTKSVNDTEEYLKKALEDANKEEAFDFGIYFNEAQIGSGGFNKISKKNRSGEIGYWISKDFEGKSIITDVVKTLIEFGKSKFNLHRIVIRMDTNNKRSQAVPKRLGFEFEGVLRHEGIQNGKFVDHEIWSILV